MNLETAILDHSLHEKRDLERDFPESYVSTLPHHEGNRANDPNNPLVDADHTSHRGRDAMPAARIPLPWGGAERSLPMRSIFSRSIGPLCHVTQFIPSTGIDTARLQRARAEKIAAVLAPLPLQR